MSQMVVVLVVGDGGVGSSGGLVAMVTNIMLYHCVKRDILTKTHHADVIGDGGDDCRGGDSGGNGSVVVVVRSMKPCV